ncbi:hypothetical protein SK128_002409 [Halocaridina rubra]|uniref:Uncharacterized protein n=1 Tax=Halocaridina rubra TaxID=373956 RepID=A0AAN8XD65_HALRR
MQTSRSPMRNSSLSRRTHRRSRSHISPQRRPRRRTHSHSPVRRHGRGHHHHHQVTRGRSPTRVHAGASRTLGPQRVCHQTATLTTTCSTMPTHSISYSPQRHRDSDVSSTACLIGGTEGEDLENRRNHRRTSGNIDAHALESIDEDLKKDSVKNRICRAAKVVSGFLIAMGLILVFYVIITTILGESTPLDIFDFEFDTGTIIHHQNNHSDNLLKARDRILSPEIRDISSYTLDVIDIEPRSTENQSEEDHLSHYRVGDLLKRRDHAEFTDQIEDEYSSNIYDYYDVHYHNSSYSSPAVGGNATNKTTLEGRSYIAYIPVPLNDEDDDEIQEEEEDDKDSKTSSNPMFVPVMIVPSGRRNSNRHVNPMANSNFGTNRQFPLPPARGPLLIQPPRPTLLPSGNMGKILPNLQSPSINLNSFANRQSNYMPHIPPMPLSRNDFSNLGKGMMPNLSLLNSQHGNLNNGKGNGFHNGNMFISGNTNGNPGSDMTFRNIGNILSENRNLGTSRGDNFPSETILKSLREIMIRGQSNSPPHIASGTTGLMTTESGKRPISQPPPRPSLSDIRRLGLPNPRIPEIRRRMRPRLLPKSRMSGPLPRYRFRYPPPILPPLGMPIVPRRHAPKPTGPSRKPPKNFQYQYPKDSESIQDIIRYMKDRERNQNNGHALPGINFGRPEFNGYTIGDQNHILGPSPFEDHISDLLESHEDVTYRGDAQSGSNLNGGGSDITRNGNKYSMGGHTLGGGGSNVMKSGGGGIPGFNSNSNNHNDGGYSYNENGGNNYNRFKNEYNNGPSTHSNGNDYNGGSNSFSNGNSYNSGNNYNSVNSHNNGNSYNSGNNYSAGNHYSGGNNHNNDNSYNSGNNYSDGNHYSGGNSYNDGNKYNSGNNYNNGNNYNSNGNDYYNGNSFNSGSNYNTHNIDQGENNYHSGNINNHNTGGSIISSIIPSVFNTYNTKGSSKPTPFNIMLDVYPMDVGSGTSGSRPFQSTISFDTNDLDISDRQRYNPSNGSGRHNSKDTNKHEVILHLNLYSKTPPSLKNSGSSGNGLSSRSGAVSLAVPLTGQMSPVDIYRAIMTKARAEKPQAQVQIMSGEEATGERDEVEIELFDVEEGPRLLEAIRQGLQKLNTNLPPESRFLISDEVASPVQLYEAVNGETVSSPGDQSASGEKDGNVFANHNYNVNSSLHSNYDDTDYYYYYDYYEYEDSPGDDTARDTDERKTKRESEILTSTVSNVGPYEMLPTPCWHLTDSEEDDHYLQ